MTRLHLYPGWIGPNGGRALLVSEGATEATPPTVEAFVSGQTVQCLVGPPPAVEPHRAPEGALAFALAGQHSVRIYQVRIPGPLHERARLVARLGEVRTWLDVTPLPSAPDDGVSFALASCYYGYFRQRFRYAAMLENAARIGAYGLPPIAFKLLVGDNLYLDVSPDQLEFRNGYAETARRYADLLALDEASRRVFASSPSIVTWDDHDLWNDYPYESKHLDRSSHPMRATYEPAALAGIDIQDALNPPIQPGPGAPRGPGERSFTFEAAGIPFFVADIRTRRTEATFMPEGELSRLERWLATLPCPGILVLGQPLATKPKSRFVVWGSDRNLPSYSAQYARLLGALRAAPYDVLVLSGDVHFSRVLKLTVGDRPIWEIVSSPAVHIPKAIEVVWRYLFRWELDSQGRDGVEIPDDFGPVPADRRLRLAEYVYGTSSSNVAAFIHARRVGGSLDVRATFVDHERDVFPDAERVGSKRPTQSVGQGRFLSFKLASR